MQQYVENIISPYLRQKRQELKLPHGQPAVLIFDNFKAQCTELRAVKIFRFKQDRCGSSPNCTDCLQPLDVSVNKAAKEFLHKKFHEWYAKQPIAAKSQDPPSRSALEYC